LAAIKPAHRGVGVIVRFYEAFGGAGPAEADLPIAVPDGWIVRGEVDLLERPVVTPRSWGPFVVRSWAFDPVAEEERPIV
jgi:hypothetical protein